MEFVAYASSSKGNLYTLSDGQERILIECGLPIREVKKLLGFSLSGISFCLLSHGHSDHSKAAADIMRAGVDIYTSQGTIDALKLHSHRAHVIRAGKQFASGNWIVLPIEAQHDAPEALAFLVYNKTTRKRMLFATDTYYLKNAFAGLDIIAVECNYAADILQSNVESGAVPAAMKNRLLKSHFSLENVKKFLKANDLNKVQEIWLVHLSDGNSDAERFKREIQELTGKPTYIAGV